jgi:hypothetical protein
VQFEITYLSFLLITLVSEIQAQGVKQVKRRFFIPSTCIFRAQKEEMNLHINCKLDTTRNHGAQSSKTGCNGLLQDLTAVVVAGNSSTLTLSRTHFEHASW